MKQLPHFQNDEEARVWFDTHDTADFMASMEPIILADEDWLNDSEEEMQAEDALWAESMARHPEQFAALSAAARAEMIVTEPAPMMQLGGVDGHKLYGRQTLRGNLAWRET